MAGSMGILLLLVVLPLSWAQFPAVCNTRTNLKNKMCCPNNCGTHGTCASIRQGVVGSWSSANTSIVSITNSMPGWPQDVRHQWPTRVFDMVCNCNTGWGGYDCSRCDFGYTDNGAGECVKKSSHLLLMRRNFLKFSDEERENYIQVLKAAKNEEVKEWAVVVSEPYNISGSFTLQNVSAYDMFVMHHFLAAREMDNDDCKDRLGSRVIDFAHEGTTFLTWHRYYLLLVERELHRVAKKMGVNNFHLAYWDWSPIDTNLFTTELFGTPRHSSRPVNVNGDLFDNMWPVVCDQHYRSKSANEPYSCTSVRTLCNIESDRTKNQRLQRGITPSRPPFLPTVDSVLLALSAAKYNDSATYDNDTGFNRRLEGYVELCAGENPKCFFTKEGASNNLHNAVHIYIGGHMQAVPAASNDPIFFLHHANVDRIFEAWLRKFSGNKPPYQPRSGGHPGHNLNDFLVPFFPLKTNAQMYKISSELGYQYDDTTWNIPSSDFAKCTTNFEVNECLKVKGGESNGSSTNTRVPLRTILIAGTCALLIVLKLFNM